jgi:hypothetical protein
VIHTRKVVCYLFFAQATDVKKLIHSLFLVILFGTFADAADPLASEIANWEKFIETNKSTSEDWKSIKEGSTPLLQRAEKALAAGHRNFALHLLAYVQSNLAGERYRNHPPGNSKSLTDLEKEWRKKGPELQSAAKQTHFKQIPASVRAVAEASLSEVKPLYDSSLEYGKSTAAEYGFFYLGASQGRLELAHLLSTMQTKNLPGLPELPGLAEEIEKTEDAILSEYKPPASIEQHPVFIRASGLLKQARELYANDMFYGALYKMLDASSQLSKITDAGQSISAEEAKKRADEISARLNQDKADHSIALIFVEFALEEPHDGEKAHAIFKNVLPHYFSALQPSKVKKQKETAVATVTLVRWPYT